MNPRHLRLARTSFHLMHGLKQSSMETVSVFFDSLIQLIILAYNLVLNKEG